MSIAGPIHPSDAMVERGAGVTVEPAGNDLPIDAGPAPVDWDDVDDLHVLDPLEDMAGAVETGDETDPAHELDERPEPSTASGPGRGADDDVAGSTRTTLLTFEEQFQLAGTVELRGWARPEADGATLPRDVANHQTGEDSIKPLQDSFIPLVSVGLTGNNAQPVAPAAQQRDSAATSLPSRGVASSSQPRQPAGAPAADMDEQAVEAGPRRGMLARLWGLVGSRACASNAGLGQDAEPRSTDNP